MTKLLSDEQERRAMFCKMTGRVATIDTQSYFAFCKGIEAADALELADKRIAELEAELERERMRLVACGVVAMADTPDNAKEARKMHPDYESAACSDVARRVDECIELRSKLAVAREALKKAAHTNECRARCCKGGDEWIDETKCDCCIGEALAQIGEKS